MRKGTASKRGRARDASRRVKQGSEPPLYQVVVKTLQAEIVRGIYSVGTLLPSEAALMRRFGVSRQTVRFALRTLREAGLVKSHQGLGTLVQSLATNRGYVHHVGAIRDLFPVNVQTRYAAVDGKLAALPEYVQSFLGADKDGTWLHIRGHRLRENSEKPFNELDVFVAGRFAGVGRVIDSHAGSVYAAIEMIYGEVVSEVYQVISGFTANKEHGAKLGLKPGEAGIEIRRIFRIASDNEVALISLNRYRSDEFTFAITLRRMNEEHP